MILPSSIHITKAEEIIPPTSNDTDANGDAGAVTTSTEPRVISKDAIVNKTDKMCATGESLSYTTVNPGTLL